MFKKIKTLLIKLKFLIFFRKKVNILYIGYGNMGSVVAKQINSMFLIKKCFIVNSKINQLQNLKQNIKFDIVCFFVKPQEIQHVWNSFDYKNFINQDTIFFSIAAGKDYNFFNNLIIKNIKFVRYMPNLGLKQSLGVGSLYTQNISTKLTQLIYKGLKLQSKIILTQNQDDFHILTACFGSGIAFVAYVIDNFNVAIQNSLKQKLTSDKSKEYFNSDISILLLKDMIESVFQIKTISNIDFTDLIKNISSKGGTTEAGLEVLKSLNLEKHFQDTMLMAYKKSIELSTNKIN